MKTKILTSCIIVILLAAIFGVGYLIKVNVFPDPAIPYGKVIMTVVDLEDPFHADGSNKYKTYALSLNDTETSLDPYPLGNPESRNQLPEFLSTETDASSFVASWGPISAGKHEYDFRIFKYNRISNEYEEVAGSDYYYERAYAFASTSNRLAFMGQLPTASSEQDFWDLEKWRVVIVDLNTKTTSEVGTGGYPVWSPDNSQLLFLSSDGLYLHDTETDNSSLILRSDGAIDISSYIALSHDGSTLAWTASADGVVEIYDIGWNPFVLNYRKDIPTSDSDVYWPVFSPNDELLALQSIDKAPTLDDRTNPRIDIYNIESSERVASHSLENFDFPKTFVDYWLE